MWSFSNVQLKQSYCRGYIEICILEKLLPLTQFLVKQDFSLIPMDLVVKHLGSKVILYILTANYKHKSNLRLH